MNRQCLPSIRGRQGKFLWGLVPVNSGWRWQTVGFNLKLSTFLGWRIVWQIVCQDATCLLIIDSYFWTRQEIVFFGSHMSLVIYLNSMRLCDFSFTDEVPLLLFSLYFFFLLSSFFSSPFYFLFFHFRCIPCLCCSAQGDTTFLKTCLC